jgi:integrase
MTDVARLPEPERPDRRTSYLVELRDVVDELQEAATAAGTRRVYAGKWARFVAWCERPDVQALSMPTTEAVLVAFVAHLRQEAAAAGKSVTPSTVDGYVAAIKRYHADAGHPLVTGAALTRVLQGHARIEGRAARHRPKALRTKDAQRIASAIDPTNIADVRDLAVILLGYATGSRRSELVSWEIEHVTLSEEGMTVQLPKSKADQEGRGRVKVVPYGKHVETCPVLAYQAWIRMSGLTTGKVFRRVHRSGSVFGAGLSDKAISLILTKWTGKAGLPGDYSPHSLRRGFATEAAAQGVPRHQIMKDGGWASSAVDVYFEEGTQFHDRAASRLGL